MLSLTIVDLFSMAIEFERNGVSFYARAAASAAGRPHAALLHRLAAMEQMHEKRFIELRQPLGESSDQAPFEPPEEKALYIKALADTRIFPVSSPDPDTLAHSGDLAGALRYAIEREKDSIVFYSTMQDLVPLHQGRAQIRAIIDEELGHVHLLTAELSKIIRTGA